MSATISNFFLGMGGCCLFLSEGILFYPEKFFSEAFANFDTVMDGAEEQEDERIGNVDFLRAECFQRFEFKFECISYVDK